MSYGLPCPTEMDPMQVFSGVEQFDTALARFVDGVMAILQQQRTEAGAAIGFAIDAINRRMTAWMREINGLIGNVYVALQTISNSNVFVTNVQLQRVVMDIATGLQMTTEDVQYGQYPPQSAPADYPPSAVPYPGQTPNIPSPGFLPGNNPAGPPSAFPPLPVAPGYPPGVMPPNPPGGQFVVVPTSGPTQVVMDGLPVQVKQVCPNIVNNMPAYVDGVAYIPTITVMLADSGISLGKDGTPIIQVGYDRQSDGSLVVNVGPVYVQVSMPAKNPEIDPPACPVVPLIS